GGRDDSGSGDPFPTAGRLADSAAIGAAYAGARTAAATRHLASWRALRPLRLRGKREPVEAYELLGLHDAPGTRTPLGDEAPFVGREVELGQVAGRLAEVIDRKEPRVLVFTAEAGIGLTRFASEVARYAVGDAGPARVLSVRCAAFGERRRLVPLADLVRAASGLPAEEVERSAVERRLRRLSARLDVPLHVESLLALLGYAETTAPEGGSGATAPPDTLRALDRRPTGAAVGDGLDTVAAPVAVAGLLSGLAGEAPVLVILDDLHAATDDTLTALGETVSRLSGPVLVLLLGRPELVRTTGALASFP